MDFRYTLTTVHTLPATSALMQIIKRDNKCFESYRAACSRVVVSLGWQSHRHLDQDTRSQDLDSAGVWSERREPLVPTSHL
jgi:hypothetical protein